MKNNNNARGKLSHIPQSYVTKATGIGLTIELLLFLVQTLLSDFFSVLSS